MRPLTAPGPSVRHARAAVGRNFMYGLIGSGVLVTSNFGVNLLLARSFGPADYGAVFAQLSLATVLLSVCSFGFQSSLNMIVRRDGRGDYGLIAKYAGNILAIQLAVIPLLVALLILCGRVIGIGNYWLYLVFLVQAGLFSFTSLPRNILWSLGEFGRDFLVSSIRPIVLLGAVLVVVTLKLEIEHVALAYLAATGTACVVGYVVVRSVLRDGMRQVSWSLWPGIGRTAMPLIGIYALLPVYLEGNTVLVRWIVGPAEAGLYVAAARMLTVVVFISNALLLALFPKLQDEWTKGHEEGQQYLHDTVRGASLLSMTLTVVGFVYASEIIHVVYGSEFSEAASVLRLLSLAIVFRVAQRLWNSSFMASSRERTVLYATVFVSLLGAGLSAILIVTHGSAGAALGMLLMEIGFYITYLIAGRRYHIVALGFRDHSRLLLFGIALGGFAVLFRTLFSYSGLVLLVPVACALTYWLDRRSAIWMLERIRDYFPTKT